MKSIKIILLGLAAMFALAGCGETNKIETPKDSDGSIVGEWHLVSWSSLDAADIYMSFGDDGTFDIYQRLYKPTYSHYDGTYRISGNTLNGTYSDGTAWSNASYVIGFSDNGNRLTLTGTTAGDTAVYVKEPIPSYILSGELGTKLATDEPEEEPRFL